MGKKGWFSTARRVLSLSSEKKDKKLDKSKKKWFQKEEPESMDVISFLEQSPLDVPVQPPPIEDDVKQTESKKERSVLEHSEAVEPAVDAAQPDGEVERSPSIISCCPEMSEEVAAIMIQTAFRGYTARRALRALKALMRLKSLVHGQSVKRQVVSTLKSMQTLSHVQTEIRARRIRMSEENQALQRHLRLKREKELEKLKTPMDGDWNHSTQSKAQVEAKLLNKQEASLRRERALAYSYSHQQTWKNSSKTATDPNNPHWGWSWLERWMAARPWEPRSMADHQDNLSVTSVATRASVVDIIEVYGRRDQNLATQSSPRTPTSQKSSQLLRQRSASTPKVSSPSGRKKTAANQGLGSWGGDDDVRSVAGVKAKLSRRHTIAGPSFRDSESLVSLPSVASYTNISKAVKTRSRLASSSGTEKKGTTLEKGSASANSAKKRLSFTTSPAKPRRLSSPPIVNA